MQTLHFYEREGLIPPPARSASGYRLYDAGVIDRIRFIRQAQALGLPLLEIEQVLALAARGTSPCGRVHSLRTELKVVVITGVYLAFLQGPLDAGRYATRRN